MDKQESKSNLFAIQLTAVTGDYLAALRATGVSILDVYIEITVPVGDLPAFGTGHKNIWVGQNLYSKTSKNITIDDGEDMKIAGTVTVHEETPRRLPDDDIIG